MKNTLQERTSTLTPVPLLDSVQIQKMVEENNLLNDKISCLELSLKEAKQKIAWFEEQVRRSKHHQFGKSSEALKTLQAEIIFNADETPFVSVASEAVTDEVATQPLPIASRKAKVGRTLDLSQLPHQRQLHDLGESEKTCQACGQALHKIGEDVSKQVEIIPRQLYVVEHVHPKYACRHCETISSAKKALSPIPKSLAGASLLTEVILNKYEMHLPLYRQAKIFASHKIDLGDNTLGNWVMGSAEVLEPLQQAFVEEMQRAEYLQVDETPVKVLEPEKKAYLWCFLSPLKSKRFVYYQFDLTRKSVVVDTALKEFKGLLQTDGYRGYGHQQDRKDMVCFGCFAHARRKFAEVIKTSEQKTGKAHEGLNYITLLYRIEQNAKERNLDFAARQQAREKEALPILHKMHAWLLRSKEQVPPQSGIGQAITYTLNQWPHLIRYVHYGSVEIDNNGVENQIRPFALGRRNWLFVGNESSAQKAALLYSLIQSAKLNDLNPRIYLHYSLTQVHALRKKEIKAVDLLPHHIDHKSLEEFAARESEKAKSLFAAFNN